MKTEISIHVRAYTVYLWVGWGVEKGGREEEEEEEEGRERERERGNILKVHFNCSCREMSSPQYCLELAEGGVVGGAAGRLVRVELRLPCWIKPSP